MVLAVLIWLALGAAAGAFSAFLMPKNSYGWRIDIAVGIFGAIAGGLAWPMLNIFLGVGLFNAVIGGSVGAALAIPVMRMVGPELELFLYPDGKL